MGYEFSSFFCPYRAYLSTTGRCPGLNCNICLIFAKLSHCCIILHFVVLRYRRATGSSSSSGRWIGGCFKTPHCGTYVIRGLLPSVATSRFLVWGFFETLLHFGKENKLSSRSTFTTLLRFNLFEVVEKSVIYQTRAKIISFQKRWSSHQRSSCHWR